MTMTNKDNSGSRPYNSLHDTHLQHYFSNPRIRKHLQGNKLVTKDGRVVPDQEWHRQMVEEKRREKEKREEEERILRREKEKKEYDDAIGRLRNEEKIKMATVERRKNFWNYEQELVAESHNRMRMLALESPGNKRRSRSRPKSASQKQGSSNLMATTRLSRSLQSLGGKQFLKVAKKEASSCPGGPYFLSTLDSLMRISSVPNMWRPNHAKRKALPTKMAVDVRHHLPGPCQITFKFYGSSFIPAGGVGEHLVEVKQQPTGAGLVTIFKNTLKRGDEFTVTSRRSTGCPFSLAFYTDNVIALRVSTCCEFKHPPGRRLGGPSGHYAVVDVTGGQRCYRCEMANDESIQKHSKNVKKLREKLHDQSQRSLKGITETHQQEDHDHSSVSSEAESSHHAKEIPDSNNNEEDKEESEEIHTDSGEEVHTEDEIDSIQEDEHNKHS